MATHIVINTPPLTATPNFDGFAAAHPWIGTKIGKPLLLRGGYSQQFQAATAYGEFGSGPAEVHEVHGAIRDRYVLLGGADGWLGFPATDETATPDGAGRFNHFAHGSIFWTPTTGAHEVHGAIRDTWASMGWERSHLRYPTTDELAAPGGRISHFEGGSISWTAGGGAVPSGVAPEITLRPVADQGRFIEVVGTGFTPYLGVKLGYDISSGGGPTTHQIGEAQFSNDGAGGFTHRIKVNLGGDISGAQAQAMDMASGVAATAST